MNFSLERQQLAELLQTRVDALEAEIYVFKRGIGRPLDPEHTMLKAREGALYEILHLARHFGVEVRTRVPLGERVQENYPKSMLDELKGGGGG